MGACLKPIKGGGGGHGCTTFCGNDLCINIQRFVYKYSYGLLGGAII